MTANEPTTYRDTKWTAEIDRALKNRPDFEVCLQFNIRRWAVRKRRIELGIIVERETEPKWTQRQERLLGTLPDTELAAQWGIAVYWVRKHRLDLSIEPYVMPETVAAEYKPTPHVWTAVEKKRLGTQPDTVIADWIGVAAGTVTAYRNRLGIAPFRRGGEVEWTAGMLRLLGEVPDGTLAREYEISHSAVKIRRIQEGIPPAGQDEMDPEPELPLDVIEQIGKVCDKRLSDVHKVSRIKIRIYRALHDIPAAPLPARLQHQWTPADDKVLGTMSDRLAAVQIGVTADQAMYRRKLLGIPPLGVQATIRWTQNRIDCLGNEPDHTLAKRWTVTQSAVRKKREELGIPKCDQTARQLPQELSDQFGMLPDNQLARLFGLPPAAVRNARTAAGIPPFRDSKPYHWKKRDLKRLGKIHDDDLAKELDLSPQFIAAKRLELNIPAHRRVRKVDWHDPQILQKLGEISDGQLARELSVTPGAVANKRKNLGIPAFDPHRSA